MSDEFGLCEDYDVAEDDGIFDLLVDMIDTSDPNYKSLVNPNGNGRVSGGSCASKGGKKRKVNPDAETIAAVTEEALRELDLDPDSQDAKKKRRQIRNRLSAQFHRDRKNAYIKTLEEAVEQKNMEIAQLQQTILALKTENEILKQASILPAHIRTSSIGSTDVESIGSHSPGPADSPLLSHHSSIESHIPAFSLSPPVPGGGVERSKLFGAPIFKSLAVLSVLCIICVSTLSNPSINPTNPTLVYTTSPVVHRRLEHVDDRMEILSTYTITTTEAAPPALPTTSTSTNGANTPMSTIYSTVNTSSSLERNHLRRSNQATVITTGNTSAVVQEQPSHNNHNDNNNKHRHTPLLSGSKDLIPLMLPNQQQQHDWLYHQQQPFPSLSYSHIVMNNGMALFDPEMQFGQHDLDAMLTYSIIHKGNNYQYTTTTAPGSAAAATNTATASVTASENDHRMVPYEANHHNPPANALTKYQGPDSMTANTRHIPRQNDDFDSDNGSSSSSSSDSGSENEEKHWPAITTNHHQLPPPPSPIASHHHHHNLESMKVDCEIDKQALISQMLSASNLITVSLPASSVRLGKSFSESRDGTMEGILQLFNLTNTAEGATAYPTSTADAMIELNCILLNAKLVMSSTSST